MIFGVFEVGRIGTEKASKIGGYADGFSPRG